MLMMGKQNAQISAVRLVDIHGTRFLDIEYCHDDTPTTMRAARVGPESVYPNPRPGDQVVISYLMNVVTAITRR